MAAYSPNTSMHSSAASITDRFIYSSSRAESLDILRILVSSIWYIYMEVAGVICGGEIGRLGENMWMIT